MVRYSSQFKLQSNRFNAPQQLWSLTLIGAVLLGAISEQPAIALPLLSRPLTAQLNQPQQSSPEARLPRLVQQRVRQDLSQRLDIPRRDLSIVSFSQETWPDSCLGLAAPNERCAMAIVDGWRVEVTNGQQNWVYRTDQMAQVMRTEAPNNTNNNDLPPEISDRLLQTVAQQTQVSAATLKITEVQPAFFDGCMGIYEPDQFCNEIGLSSWRVIITGQEQSWVYHVSQDGSRIVQNATASGSRGVVPSFIPTNGQQPAPMDQTIVFRAVISGGLAGTMSEMVLASDGNLYRRVWSPNLPQPVAPIIETRLSPQQVRQFQQVLQEQKFPNLDGLRYITDAAFADYPTTTLQAMGSTVEYIDLEQDNLPQALQAVIQAWEQLD
jgi:hypothetical protein